jgi:hypothetical protein
VVYLRKHSALLAICVLFAYFYIAQASIENKHTHFYANGVVITHSHSVNHENGKPIQNHKHSKSEIIFFSTVHFDFYEATTCLSVDFEKDEFEPEIPVLNDEVYYSTSLFAEVSRGPPAQFIC